MGERKGGWRKSKNKEHNNLYSTTNKMRTIKRIRIMRYVAQMEGEEFIQACGVKYRNK
jgi:hypothetical protein